MIDEPLKSHYDTNVCHSRFRGNDNYLCSHHEWWFPKNSETSNLSFRRQGESL